MSLKKLRNAVKAAGLGVGGVLMLSEGAHAACGLTGCDTTCKSGSCTTQCVECASCSSCSSCSKGDSSAIQGSLLPGENPDGVLLA